MTKESDREKELLARIAELESRVGELSTGERGWLITSPQPGYDSKGVYGALSFTDGWAFLKEHETIPHFVSSEGDLLRQHREDTDPPDIPALVKQSQEASAASLIRELQSWGYRCEFVEDAGQLKDRLKARRQEAQAARDVAREKYEALFSSAKQFGIVG